MILVTWLLNTNVSRKLGQDRLPNKALYVKSLIGWFFYFYGAGRQQYVPFLYSLSICFLFVIENNEKILYLEDDLVTDIFLAIEVSSI